MSFQDEPGMRTSRTIMYASLVLLLTSAMLAFTYWYPGEKIEEPDQSAALIEQVIVLYKQRKYGEVLQKLEEIPENSVRDWRIPYYRGSAQVMLRDYEKAITSLEQAMAISDQEPGILYALGVVYFKQGNLKLAKAYFASVLEINPADESARGLIDTIANLERRQSNDPKSTIEPTKMNPDSHQKIHKSDAISTGKQ